MWGDSCWSLRKVPSAIESLSLKLLTWGPSHPEPSRADEAITKRLKEALALVDVRSLDHVIVAGSDTTSFAERGLI